MAENLRTLVPLIGGLALICGGTATLMVDRLDLLADPHAPGPIMIRYTSQATYDLHKRPHWIFVATVAIFVPCLLVTAHWQAELLSQESVEDDQQDLQDKLILQSTLCALGGFLVAISPMGNVLGTTLHIVFAAFFATFGIMYTFQTVYVADELGHDTLSTARFALSCLGFVGSLVTIFSVYPGGQSTEKLLAHQKAVIANDTTATDRLTENDIWWARVGESCLAVGQITIAISVGATLLTACVEVGDLEDSPSGAWISAIIAAAAMLVLGSFFVYTNDMFYNMCQKATATPPLENNHGKDEDELPDSDNTPQPIASGM